jgi:hypothetical protein
MVFEEDNLWLKIWTDDSPLGEYAGRTARARVPCVINSVRPLSLNQKPGDKTVKPSRLILAVCMIATVDDCRFLFFCSLIFALVSRCRIINQPKEQNWDVLD